MQKILVQRSRKPKGIENFAKISTVCIAAIGLSVNITVRKTAMPTLLLQTLKSFHYDKDKSSHLREAIRESIAFEVSMEWSDDRLLESPELAPVSR